MNVKKIVLAMTVVLMGTIVMNAQPPRRHHMDPEQMVQQRVERLDKQLSLTDEQKAEITRIYTEEMESRFAEGQQPPKMEKGEKPDEATMKARHEEMKARRDATDAKIEALLTPEQAAKYAELKTHEGPRSHDMHHKGPRRSGEKAPGCDCNCTCKGKSE